MLDLVAEGVDQIGVHLRERACHLAEADVTDEFPERAAGDLSVLW